MLNDRGSFIYPKPFSFPVIIRCSQKYLHRFKFHRAFQPGNIEIGNLFSNTYLFRPHIIVTSFIFKYGSIQRKCPEGKFILIRTLHPASFHPLIPQGILPQALQNVRTDVPLVFCFSGCKIQIPLSFQIVKFRRPDMRSHRTCFMFVPDQDLPGLCQIFQNRCPAKRDFVISGQTGCKVIGSIRMPVNVWVRPLRNPYIFIPFSAHVFFSSLFLCCSVSFTVLSLRQKKKCAP